MSKKSLVDLFLDSNQTTVLKRRTFPHLLIYSLQCLLSQCDRLRAAAGRQDGPGGWPGGQPGHRQDGAVGEGGGDGQEGEGGGLAGENLLQGHRSHFNTSLLSEAQ